MHAEVSMVVDVSDGSPKVEEVAYWNPKEEEELKFFACDDYQYWVTIHS